MELILAFRSRKDHRTWADIPTLDLPCTKQVPPAATDTSSHFLMVVYIKIPSSGMWLYVADT